MSYVFDDRSRTNLIDIFSELERAMKNSDGKYYIAQKLTEKDGVYTSTIEFPGFDNEDIKSIEYNKKTQIVEFKLESGDVKKTLSFTMGKIQPETLKVVSYNKGMLVVEAKKVIPASPVVKIL